MHKAQCRMLINHLLSQNDAGRECAMCQNQIISIDSKDLISAIAVWYKYKSSAIVTEITYFAERWRRKEEGERRREEVGLLQTGFP